VFPKQFQGVNFAVDKRSQTPMVSGSIKHLRGYSLNSELCRQALLKVGNPNVLVNLVSRRVRQLNSGGGSISRPLVGDIGNLGAADIALREIIEDKIGFDMPEELLVSPEPVHTNRRRKKQQH